MSKRKQGKEEAKDPLEEKSVFDLRLLLRQNGLTTTGKKADLISRLNEAGITAPSKEDKKSKEKKKKASVEEEASSEEEEDKEETKETKESSDEEEDKESELKSESEEEEKKKEEKKPKRTKKPAPKPPKGSKEDLGGHTPKELTEIIKKKGGLVNVRVTSKTTHLLCGGDDGSEKYIKAIEYSVPIIDFYDFQKLIKGKELKTEVAEPKSPRKGRRNSRVFDFVDEGLDAHPPTPKKKKTTSTSKTTTRKKRTTSTTTKKKQATRQSYRRRSGDFDF